MKQKAMDNLKACECLVDRRLFDPAMSRLYYAFFHAATHALEHKKKKPAKELSEDGCWSHTVVAQNIRLIRDSKEDRVLYGQAKSLREQADYGPVPLRQNQVTDMLDEIEPRIKEYCK